MDAAPFPPILFIVRGKEVDRSANTFQTQDVGRNICHGSDAVESAKKEIALWFGEDEVQSYKQSQQGWIYEKP